MVVTGVQKNKKTVRQRRREHTEKNGQYYALSRNPSIFRIHEKPSRSLSQVRCSAESRRGAGLSRPRRETRHP
jgi:hypothetical protein